jgi:hypothetical protein
MCILQWILLRIRNISDTSCTECQNTFYGQYFFFFENRAVYEITRKKHKALCFSTARFFTRTRHKYTLYAYVLPLLYQLKPESIFHWNQKLTACCVPVGQITDCFKKKHTHFKIYNKQFPTPFCHFFFLNLTDLGFIEILYYNWYSLPEICSWCFHNAISLF